MAVIGLFDTSKNDAFLAALVFGAAVLCCNLVSAISNAFFHPLSAYPGPRLWAASRLPYLCQLARGRLHEALRELHEHYGPVVRVAPDELSYATNSAWQDIYSGGVGNKGFPKSNVYHNAQTFESMFDADDTQHTRLRRLLKNDYFSLCAVRKQETLVQEYADKLVAQLKTHHCKNAKPANLQEWYNWIAFDVIGRVTLSEDFGCLDGLAYHPWIAMLLTHFKLSVLVMVGGYFPVFPRLFLLIAPKTMVHLRDAFLGSIRDKVRRRRERGIPPGDSDSVKSALREDVGTSDETPVAPLTQDELEANATLLVLAGSETMTTSMLSATHYLCHNPVAMARVAAEVRAIAPREEDITMDTTTNCMPYLNAVIHETHRLAPPVANGPARVVNCDGVCIAGRPVPRGTSVGVTQFAANRIAANFTQPLRFIPERWLTPAQVAALKSTAGTGPSDDADLQLDPAQFASDVREVCRPFTLGGRDCLGQNLAWVEFRLLLARMIWNLKFEACPSRPRGDHGVGAAGGLITDMFSSVLALGKKTRGKTKSTTFADWTDQHAYLLWAKDPYYVMLKGRK